MSRRTLFRASAAIGLAAPAHTATQRVRPRPDSTVVFSDDFSSGNLSSWPLTGLNGNGTMGVVAGPTDAQNPAARFTIPDDGQSYRSEVALRTFGYGQFRFRLSTYLPANWTPFSAGTITAQWHGYKLVNGADTNPPIQLAVIQDYWQVRIHHLVDPTTVVSTSFDLGACAFGAWSHWDFNITWSTPDSDGLVTASLNGTQVLSHPGPNNYHQDLAPYFHLGIYRPNWNPANFPGYPTGGPDVVVYDDDIIIEQL
ncbi:hypothetical protein JOF29_007266 [Kribbella aluminosa]|uniref:Polysaccharide lyase-like protein n=1 Tax=Kribbella aluminosa TaxID=416017 RepID=A0ABS4UX98_9ACTN|nr:polysaccharide lyase [Kribbella aluminosa]MBP2356156.1 hypothetical protein [Kribbella aluminosa]